MRASVHSLTLPVLAILVAAGCGPLREGLENATTQTVTLQPTVTGAARSAEFSTTFGVCPPASLDGRGRGSATWEHFVSLTMERPDIQGLAGHEIGISRGESCHLRVVSQFQAMVSFPIGSLPAGAVTSAVLRGVPLLDRVTDAPIPPGTREQCEILAVGRATSPWTPGPTQGALVTWAGIPPPPPRFGRYARFGPIDVTRAVRAWRDGAAPNLGFVITPPSDKVEAAAEEITEVADAYSCDLLLGQFELDVTLLIPGS